MHSSGQLFNLIKSFVSKLQYTEHYMGNMSRRGKGDCAQQYRYLIDNAQHCTPVYEPQMRGWVYICADRITRVCLQFLYYCQPE